MLNICSDDVTPTPFPHAISQNILAPEMYRRLRTDYPGTDIFEAQNEQSAGIGSRTRQGFDIYRGDLAYERLIQRSAAWREFDAYINSERFVADFLELFAPHLENIALKARVTSAQYEPTLIEGREALIDRAPFSQRLLGRRGSFRRRNPKALRLFSRLDIHKATAGYAKPVHCDRANRLCSLIIYFSDAEASGLRGGRLTLHEHRRKKPITKYERHPKPKEAPVAASITPRQNTGLLFPCCNHSYHGVTAVETEGIERDFVYINISAETHSLW